MKVLITGGAGFIGSHLADRAKLEHDILILDNLKTGVLDNITNHTNEFLFCNIDSDVPSSAFEGVDVVFHLAAEINLRESIKDPAKDAKTNILGSLNVIDAARKAGVKKLVFASSGGAIYSPDASLPCTEESFADPQSPYGLAKLTVEKYLAISKKLYGLDYCCLRFSNVYGPRQNILGEAGVISIFVDRLLQGKEIHINGNGQQTRDFVYCDDVVEACMLAAVTKEMSGIFNVSTGVETSVNDIVQELEVIIGKPAVVHNRVPILGELERSRLSADKLKNMGWSPKTTLRDGLIATVRYFQR